MRKVGKSYWIDIACDSERCKAAVRSWFSPLCDDMVPESAEALCDIETDREKKIRAVMVGRDGKKQIATLTRNRGGLSVSLKAA